MIHHQRGFTLIVYAVLALAILGALGGIYVAGRNAGKDSKQGEWDAANVAAQQKADADRRAREDAARAASQLLQNAQRDATAYRAKWAAERAKQPILASCEPAKAQERPIALAGPPDGKPPVPDGGMQLRLTYAFVRLWDSAWTGSDGQPLFGDPGGLADATASPLTFGPAEVLANHEENAARCSATARQLNALITLIQKLR